MGEGGSKGGREGERERVCAWEKAHNLGTSFSKVGPHICVCMGRCEVERLKR